MGLSQKPRSETIEAARDWAPPQINCGSAVRLEGGSLPWNRQAEASKSLRLPERWERPEGKRRPTTWEPTGGPDRLYPIRGRRKASRRMYGSSRK